MAFRLWLVWLQPLAVTDYNHARHRFEHFVRLHLKWLCSSIGICDGFFLPNSRALFAHFSHSFASFLPRWVSFCPDSRPSTPVRHIPLSGICTYITPRGRLPPAGVVLGVGKCAPSCPLPSAERPSESCSVNVPVHVPARVAA